MRSPEGIDAAVAKCWSTNKATDKWTDDWEGKGETSVSVSCPALGSRQVHVYVFWLSRERAINQLAFRMHSLRSSARLSKPELECRGSMVIVATSYVGRKCRWAVGGGEAALCY
jgi:hypothetical protein